MREPIKKLNPGYVLFREEALPGYHKVKVVGVMDLAKHEWLFSKERLKKYRDNFNNDDRRAVCLYKYNIQACQALYPLISILEVALRNAIDRVLAAYFDDAGWLISKRDFFANHPDMVRKDWKGR